MALSPIYTTAPGAVSLRAAGDGDDLVLVLALLLLPPPGPGPGLSVLLAVHINNQTSVSDNLGDSEQIQYCCFLNPKAIECLAEQCTIILSSQRAFGVTIHKIFEN